MAAQENSVNILTVNLLFSTFVFCFAARHPGLTFLALGERPIPASRRNFTHPAAFGDFSVLARAHLKSAPREAGLPASAETRESKR